MRTELTEVIAEVGAPAVIADAWPAALSANADTIRAALYSAEAMHAMPRGGFGAVGLFREDGRGLDAARHKKGWIVRLGETGKRFDYFGARSGSKYIGSRIKMSRVRSLFRVYKGYDHFGWEEVEKMMLEFISTPGNPQSGHWVGVDWA